MTLSVHTASAAADHGAESNPVACIADRQPNGRDLRTDLRKPLHARAWMLCDGQIVEAKTRDLNRGGISLLSPLYIVKDTPLTIQFQIRLGTTYHVIKTQCDVVHTVVGSGGSGFKMGLKFKQVAHADRQIIATYLSI